MDARRLIGATGCLSKVTLAAGNTTSVSSTGTIVYAIKGKAYSASALSSTATPTTDALTGAAFTGVKGGGSVAGAYGYGSVFVYGLDSSGNLKCAQGSITALDSAGNFVVYPQFPELPDTMCPIAYLVIKAGNTADATTGWVQGTSNQASVTGITYARTDVALGMPDRPQAS